MSYQTDTSSSPSWLQVLNIGDTEWLKPTFEQQRLFNEFKCFEIRKIYNGQDIQILTRVHKSIWNGLFQSTCSLHVTWVGGGFVTGGTDFEAWRPCHFKDLIDDGTIIFCPRYPLMPQLGAHLFAYTEAVLLWITSDECEKEIKNQCHDYKACIRAGYLDIVSGESAGGHLACHSWLSLQNVRIGVLYLRYPMLCSYRRKGRHPYRGKLLSPEDMRATTLTVLLEIFTDGPRAPRMGSTPPEGMGAAYLFSSTCIRAVINDGDPVLISTWQLFFQEPDILDRLRAMTDDCRLGNDGGWTQTQPITIDVQELVSNLEDPKSKLGAFGLTFKEKANALAYTHAMPTNKRPLYAPDIIITHGTRDTNCDVSDSQKFQEIIKNMFHKSTVNLHTSPEPHAFDYYRRGDEFMEKITREIVDAVKSPKRIAG